MLELKNIAFRVTGGEQQTDIIRELNLLVRDKKFIVITGPNGSGKSTLAKIIAGILQPTAGKILLAGQDITKKSITDRARMGIGFAFQQPVRFRGIEVFDLLKIASGRELSVMEACDYLSEVGLCANDYINREVNASLSGGELKRIEIATILARKPKLAIFDEPEAGIDLWSFQNLIRIFDNMRRDNKGGSVIIISHQERILRIADEIIVMENGAVKKQGAGKEILPEILGTDAAIDVCERLK